MVEEASAAAASMNDQAARLSQLTAFFKLRDGYTVVPTNAEFIAAPVAVSAAGAPSARAPATAAAAGRGSDSATRADRRSGARPWSKPATAVATASRTAAAATGNDWSEF
jgi:hypothetical protein